MKQDKPTSIDIAYRAGVSQSTVSRALRNSPLVSQETRDRVQAIARELNYHVDKMASNLRSQATRTIALLLCEDPTSDDSLINPFFLSMLGSITRATARQGYDLLVSFQQLTEDWHAQYEDAHRADGIILLGYGDYIDVKPKLDRLQEAGAHFTLWGPALKDLPGHSVGCDNHQGGFLAGEHLIKQGRTKIAFLGDASRHFPEFRERYLGCADALASYDLSLNPHLQEDAENLEESGYQACQQLLQSGQDFDALLAASDLIAIGAIKALQEAGIEVPGQVAVVGFDDIPSSAYVNPPLTTVLQDTSAAGELLVDNLLAQIRGESTGTQLLEPRLVVRQSCGCQATQPEG
ncbi:LacI family transcriptional regulator [Pseudomaricurvus alkylphenolicus]|jgi:alanine racemase|uniref:LacI family DNA-binding transcriptional regulator n=1 Tax=Pseudomaricurvus alkylphenolicus TaxID=1306991 RepID=UPI001421B55F|nr:LacI family DNA-binding transcriptional regulator [Pseudomaricurvus alkylphenolicus]NIB39607.1 LacI family transcriptional regulator [Pseudomaricurvus alkylphenolicus]